jgi:hypothetical protein
MPHFTPNQNSAVMREKVQPCPVGYTSISTASEIPELFPAEDASERKI